MHFQREIHVLITLAVLCTAVHCVSILPSSRLGDAYISPSGDDAAPCTLGSPCLSLIRAIDVAPEGGQVTVLDGKYAGRNNTGFAINKDITVTGQTSIKRSGYVFEWTRDSTASSTGFSVDAGKKVTFKSLTFVAERKNVGAAFIAQKKDARVRLEDVTVTNFTGGVYAKYGGIAELENVDFVNQLPYDSPSVSWAHIAQDGILIANKVNFQGSGGLCSGVYADNGNGPFTMVITNSKLSGTGSGIAMTNARTFDITIKNTEFSDFSMAAIQLTGSNGKSMIEDVTVFNTTCKHRSRGCGNLDRSNGIILGGTNSTYTVARTKLNDNGSTGSNGGGLSVSGAVKVTVEDCKFSHNTALAGGYANTGYGGGLYCSSGAELIVTGTSFDSNEAAEGGATACDSTCKVTRAIGDTFHHNTEAKTNTRPCPNLE